MTPKKVYRYLLLAFVAGLVLSVFIVRYASNWLTASSLELTQLRAEVSSLEEKRTDLNQAKQTLTEKESAIEIMNKVIPVDKDQARIVKEIYLIADKAGVTIDSVGFPASTLGSALVKPTVPAPADATTQNQNAASPTQETPKPVSKSISQATPLKDIPGVQSIELSLGAIRGKTLPVGTNGVKYAEMMSFIRQIERNQRTIQIRSLGIEQASIVDGEQAYTLTLTLVIFIRA
jgi:cell division protein FtsL